uniref:U2 snRNP-associated SURP motif-containing protein n=1 Tax=Trichuris muris TaxID=70415 RepID=A0A5S6QVW5_TRIMR
MPKVHPASRSVLARQKAEIQRRKEEEERAKEVLQEFVATFEQPDNKVGKAFVRGGVVNQAENGNKTDGGSNSPGMYQPNSVAANKMAELELARKAAEAKAKKFVEEAAKNRPKKPGKGVDGKRMSNLEAFKEELKRTQEERAERKRLREQLQEFGIAKEPLDQIAPSLDNPYMANAYDLDPTTTNLFLANLCPDINEEEIRCLFGKYGPLASVKIMWPRNDDERVKLCLTGFVAYMTRKDAERAVSGLKGHLLRGYELKLSWGKPVVIPHYPVYVPKAMLDLIAPPPPSGLPFNAQPDPKDREEYKWPLPERNDPLPENPEQREAWLKMIRNAVVKVVIPTERPLLCLIHRVIEFLIREGPMFEAMLMSREKENPSFSFLFDNQSPAHVYYRWKLFSVLQGESPSKWRTEKFRMFKGGSTWIPPPMNFFQNGMPEELYLEGECDKGSQQAGGEAAAVTSSTTGGSGKHVELLSPDQRRELENMLKVLNLERKQVGNGMMWCVEHCEAAEEIIEIITASFMDPNVPLLRKIARLYLLSDILANCTAKVLHVSLYRKYIGIHLEDIFRSLNVAYKSITARLRADQIKQRVMSCFKMWEDSAVYPSDFLNKLENIFLGRLQEEHPRTGAAAVTDVNENLDGDPFSDSDAGDSLIDCDLDGLPIDLPVIKKSSPVATHKRQEDSVNRGGFVRSKWEEVEPDRIEEQAMTTSKWEQLEQMARESSQANEQNEDIDGVPIDEAEAANDKSPTNEKGNSSLQKEELSDEKRLQLREVEVQVVQYQDKLESGRIKREKNLTIAEQVDKYREKLLRDIEQGSNSDGNRDATDEHSHSKETRDRHQNHDSDKKSSQRHAHERSRRRKRSRSRSSAGKSSRHSRRSRSRSHSRRRRKHN